MIVKSHLKHYEVAFSNKFSFLLNICGIDNRYVVIDDKVYKLYKQQLSCLMNCPFLVLKSTEKNKTVKTALNLSEAIMAFPSKRNTVLISIGGGIIQDITGFAASILYRGIKWIFIPTTLLAQTDSCIGSKTSLNHGGYKNLLGTFYPPEKIFIDTGFIPTLSRKDFFSGVGEIVKIAITRGLKGIAEFERDALSILNGDQKSIRKWIEKSLEVKKQFIEKDEFDAGERKLLNFGHTFGHALEKTSNYAVPHGQGVSIGVLIANNISESRGDISPETNVRLQKLIVPFINIKLKSEYFSDEYFNAIKKDKKRQGISLAAILLRLNHQKHGLIEAHDVQEAEIRRAADAILQLL
jgi:3-dehydroquinate synthase